MNRYFGGVLVLIVFLQSGLLLFVAHRFNFLGRFYMRIEQDRVPLLSEEYKQNQFYGWYEDIFRSYQPGADSIVFIGDSMVSVPDWNALLNAEECYVHNFGILGDTLVGVLNRIDTALRFKPRAIVIWVGINDVIKGRTGIVNGQ